MCAPISSNTLRFPRATAWLARSNGSSGPCTARTIRPTLEYDGRAHALRGPLLLDVLALAGAVAGKDTRLTLRAVDGYAATITAGQARSQGFIVATHLDGKPMALGGLGPLWAVYEADRVPQMASQPLAARFGACPWALYQIEVQGW